MIDKAQTHWHYQWWIPCCVHQHELNRMLWHQLDVGWTRLTWSPRVELERSIQCWVTASRRDIHTIVHIVSSPHRDNDHNHHFYMLPWYPYRNPCYSIAGNENLHIISEPLIKMSPSRCTVIHHHHCDKPGASLWGDTSRPEQLKTNLGVNEPWKIKWTFNSARKHHIFFIIFIFFLEGIVSWIWSKTAFYLVNL